MNQHAMQLLEYDKIKEQLKTYAVSELGKALVDKLLPAVDPTAIEGWLVETTETRAVIERSSSISMNSLSGMEHVMEKIRIGSILLPEELTILLGALRTTGRIKRFMADKSLLAPQVSSYALSMFELEDLAAEIDRCICNDRVDDRASAELAKVRRKILITEERISSKLESILRSPAYRDYIQEGVVSLRNGRYVIPVKREHRKNIQGSVQDTSTSGSTVFIEPSAVKELQEELNLWRLEEEKEVYRILSTLTAAAEASRREISVNLETMAYYDFLFAKAKLSREMEGRRVKLNTEGIIRFEGGKHPLIGKSAVPLKFSIGNGYQSLVITGPNTGGKTVALKTVGLLTMMVQSGLHVPVEEGSEFAVYRDILADIGDGQSIQQSLSTFSSHIRNIAGILACADRYSLVIMDELGTGTDPGEGMGLAVAVLEEIHSKGATCIATTHYSEIKEFAEKTPGFENGSMAFDIETLKPLYRLCIGESGESNAFLIALRLGMDRRIIERAHEVTYGEKKEYRTVQTPPDPITRAAENVLETHRQLLQKAEQTLQTRQKVEKQKVESAFRIGDCVYISSMDKRGIICEEENNKGEYGVMVMKTRFKVNKKRLSLYIDSKEMYPEDYDFDVILESKSDRKKKKIMGKRHVEGLVIELDKK